MKGYIVIGGALLLSITLVGGTLYMRASEAATKSAPTGLSVVANTNPYIEVKDEDGNGVPDWEEDLSANVIASIKDTVNPYDVATETPYEPPTTFTGKFAESFMQDYLSQKTAGASFEDPTAFVNTAVESINKNTRSKRYSRPDVRTIPDSDVAVRDYGNSIGKIMLSYPGGKENEINILGRALEANDPSVLKELQPAREAYEGLIRDTLTVPVPESLVNEHLALLSVYEAVLSDIKAMEVMFDDPLYSLARVRVYTEDATNLGYAIQSLYRTLAGRGVVYTNEEPGVYLSLFANLEV